MTTTEQWESFWRAAPPAPGSVFWDAGPEHTVARQLPLFAPHFSAGLPVVDAGCGNGTQSVILAAHFARVVGVDFSPAAIARARELSDTGGAEFRVLDLTDAQAAAALHAELGDVHVYMRGVLHQCTPEGRARVAASLAVLLGARGRAFLVEPAVAAKDTLTELMRRPEGPPESLAAVFTHGLTPMEMDDAEVGVVCEAAGLAVFAAGREPLRTVEHGADGAPVELPSQWLVVGKG
ncbi:class I SAM-dependent methyltransferase [Streptomyces sp. JJ66]|uniref:class I SAM-dependent methyltransferase n=1 Tax=Streptomyces sp. JJ66 TaxID=2803843 RepID=UPI001C56E322|nr:class I SAM-dependent methyltransferase [Streptomyces sp. JJ66]MBW1600549.1 class I SAM-dependent methyltransferase [Streptomyces sp. JJ66]